MISKKEVIKCFFNNAIKEIKEEKDVPNFNIVFMDDINSFIKDMDIDTSYLNITNNSDETLPTMYIENCDVFFCYLTLIINSLIELRYFYTTSVNKSILCHQVLTRIWMRMDYNDFDDVISFLEKQLDFIRDDTFLGYRYVREIDKFNGKSVMCENQSNTTYDETDSSLTFYISDDENIHNLSHVNYGIRYENGEKVCYIYAVQYKGGEINKKIQRKLYHLNKGIDNPNVHPNQVYTLILFINECIKNGITKIKVPKIQVLNHRYHEILSKKCEREFKNKWNYTSIIETFENPIKKRQYESDKELYSHFVDMENKIDQLKRNKLFLLVDRMKYYFDNIEFIFEDDNIKEYELRRKYE